MAINLITGHQGVSHISAEQIATLNNAMMDGYGSNKVMRMTGGAVSYTGLTVSIATGYWRVDGYDMEIQEAETIYIDPTAEGVSRIDNIYVEILQDIPTGAQRSELVVIQGEEAVSPIEPSDPTAPYLNTDILLHVVKLGTATVTEGAMVYTDETIGFEYVSPDDLDDVETIATTASTNASTALSMIRDTTSDAYDDSTAYSVGDYVIHDNTLYKCTTACSAGSWSTNSLCFTQDTLTNAVSSLNNDLNELQRLPQQITYDATKLASAVAEQNLEKYGYVIGDWWTDSNGYKYVLADLDTWYGGYSSYAILDYHHIAIVVITNQTSIWGSNTNSGYNGSTVQSYLQGTVLPEVKASLGSSHIGSHHKLFTTALSSWSWQTGKEISALTEIQVNGSKVWSLNGYQNGEGDRQLEVFRRYHYTIVWGQQHVWGRSLYSASDACFWGSNGIAICDGLSPHRGVVGLIIWH